MVNRMIAIHPKKGRWRETSGFFYDVMSQRWMRRATTGDEVWERVTLTTFLAEMGHYEIKASWPTRCLLAEEAAWRGFLLPSREPSGERIAPSSVGFVTSMSA